VQDCVVTDRHLAADLHGRIDVGVNHDEVLDVGLLADDDGSIVAAQDGVPPDADALAQVDLPLDHRGGGHERPAPRDHRPLRHWRRSIRRAP
jgi:hypothetical protein